MTEKRITLRIGPDGQVKADVSGFYGKSCLDYISVLEQMLDAEAVESDLTAEYYQNATITTESPATVEELPAQIQPLRHKE